MWGWEGTLKGDGWKGLRPDLLDGADELEGWKDLGPGGLEGWEDGEAGGLVGWRTG